jgi:ABC-type transporter Mla subunit MlaD
MALQDLTPQLRTRLSRMEKAVGWFVLLATLALATGFVYYIYHTAERKGWFLSKASYYTYLDRATGLKVDNPVKLMGFDVGQITRIDAMHPYAEYNVYVEFEIREPYYGYLWTEGSRAKVTSADFLGNRTLEVTKGTKGYPTYMFHPFQTNDLSDLAKLRDLDQWVLAEEVFDATRTNLLLKPKTALSKTNLDLLASLGREKIRVFHINQLTKSVSAVWDGLSRGYERFQANPTNRNDRNLFWLIADESPALSERLDKLIGQVETNLPNIFGLTNQLGRALANTLNLTSNLNAVAESARPVASNLAAISEQLRGRGAFGEWLLPTNLHAQLATTMTNASAALATANTALATADAALGHTDTNLAALVENLNHSLDNLAGITSNLNAQVQANTNMLTAISEAVVHTDDLIQGLKRHWLLRSAFKTKTNAPPQKLTSPKGSAR